MRFGDVVLVDLGSPVGSEAGFVRPAVVVASDEFLAFSPTTVFVVPVSSRPPSFPSHIRLDPDHADGLSQPSSAQVEQLRSISTERCSDPIGHVGAVVSCQLLDTISMILGT